METLVIPLENPTATSVVTDVDVRQGPVDSLDTVMPLGGGNEVMCGENEEGLGVRSGLGVV